MFFLKKIYENSLLFYLVVALAGLFVFMLTFKSVSDFWHREFIEAFSFIIFLSFGTALVLELKNTFFGAKGTVETEVSEETEEESETSISQGKDISNPSPSDSEGLYEWEVEEEQEKEKTLSTSKAEEKESEKTKVQKKKAVLIDEVEDNTATGNSFVAEAAGFVPESNDDPFS